MGQGISSEDVGVQMQDMRGVHTGRAAAVAREANDKECRVILWEVNMSRGCLESFNRMLNAHAIVLSLLVTVNLIGFLQPPRGWAGDSGRMFGRSWSLTTFAVANSLSLYTATSGLIFYIYCSISIMISLESVPPPSSFNDPMSVDLLHAIRAWLRKVALPSVKRRCSFLFFFLSWSLLFCMVSYISAGIASISPHDRLIGVILPAIPGCGLMLFLLYIASWKLRLEFDIKTRFDTLWTSVVPPIIDPGVRSISPRLKYALDPVPPIVSCFLRPEAADDIAPLLSQQSY